MRKITAFLLAVTILSALMTNVFGMADSADCACVMNGATGEIVFSKNIGKRHPMASTTKIMTAVIALESCPFDDIVTVSDRAAAEEGSSAYIMPGMQLYMRDMLYGLMLNSGNDAAIAIAEHVAGSVENFVDMMNLKAHEIGANDTNFTNPNGLPQDAHFTTAGDLALIARYAMRIPEFREIVGTITYEARPIGSETPLVFINHNKLFGMYPDVTGVKTGYTDAAGRCLVSSAKRSDMEFIAVTLGDANDWNDHMELLDYAFSLHYPKKVIEAGQRVRVAKVDGKEYNMIAATDFIIPFRENSRTQADVVTHISPELASPVNAGEKTGYIDICSGGSLIGRVDILSETEIPNVSGMRLRNSFFSTFMGVVRRVLV